MTTLIAWLACDCYVWPCSPIHRTGRCGFCSTVPERRVDEPATGKAGPL